MLYMYDIRLFRANGTKHALTSTCTDERAPLARSVTCNGV